MRFVIRQGWSRGDRGTALMTVMATTSILFVLATTLMLMVTYQTQTTHLRTSRLRATHVADAGINAYLYALKNESGYVKSTPDTGWVSVGDGEAYRVIAVPAANGKPLTLHSTGTADDGTVTINATVRFPSFADYMFLNNSDVAVAGDAYINGQLRTNGDVNNQGEIVGKVTAGGTVTGNGRFDQGYTAAQPRVDFKQVLESMDEMRTAAKADGTYYPASGTAGYRAVVSGTSITISEINSGTTTGNFQLTPVAVISIPPSGVVYFSDSVWVEGSYASSLTIVSDGDIYLTGDYQPATADSAATSGLIAKDNIIVPGWYKSVNDYMTVNAALLAQSGRIYADIKQGVIRSRITLIGSLSAYESGGDFGTVDKFTGQPVAGFRSNAYQYDQRLMQTPPPMYPLVQDGSLKVETWIEDKSAGL